MPLVLFGLPSCGPLGGSLHLVDAGFSLWSLLNTLCASLYQSVLVTYIILQKWYHAQSLFVHTIDTLYPLEYLYAATPCQFYTKGVDPKLLIITWENSG